MGYSGKTKGGTQCISAVEEFMGEPTEQWSWAGVFSLLTATLSLWAASDFFLGCQDPVHRVLASGD